MADVPGVLRIAARYRRELRSREIKAVKRMVAAYGNVYKQLLSEARALRLEVEAIRLAGEIIPSWRIQQMARYRALMAQVGSELGRFNVEAEHLIRVMQREALELGYDMAAAQVEALIPPAVGISFNRLPITALEQMVGFLANGSPLARLLDELGEETAQKIGKVLVQGLGAGWNPRRVARRLRQEAGLSLTRAMRIARSEQMRAWRASSVQGYRDNAAIMNGYRRQAQHGPRTCLACLLKDGEFYRLEEEFTDHVNGRCTVIPVTKSWEELGFKGIADTNVEWELGRDWFERQDAALQEGIMGGPLFGAWTEGRIGLDDCIYLRRSAEWGDAWQVGGLERALEAAG